ncbi:MAG: hypothetical protein IPO56_16590 [Flavobacteriales bacterium]|nr:hypothetical protein [Flavobacteriales bacterium]
MTLRSLLRDLTPPIILRLLRPAPTPKRVEVARKHVVQAGPLRGWNFL